MNSDMVMHIKKAMHGFAHFAPNDYLALNKIDDIINKFVLTQFPTETNPLTTDALAQITKLHDLYWNTNNIDGFQDKAKKKINEIKKKFFEEDAPAPSVTIPPEFMKPGTNGDQSVSYLNNFSNPKQNVIKSVMIALRIIDPKSGIPYWEALGIKLLAEKNKKFLGQDYQNYNSCDFQLYFRTLSGHTISKFKDAFAELAEGSKDLLRTNERELIEIAIAALNSY